METIQKTIRKIDPQVIPYYSEKDKAYQTLDQRYNGFYEHIPNIESFKDAIDAKSKQNIDRVLLEKVIRKQYANRSLNELQERNLNSIKDKNTYTLVTAHQPSLFTGPLYYIFKICSAIKLSMELQDHYSGYHFIPLFVTGGEDHDFLEVNHTSIFGKEVVWDKEVNGPVGRVKIGEDLEKAIQQFTDILGENNHGLVIKNMLQNSFSKSTTYAEFNFHLINDLFEKYGLLVMNMDSHLLKNSFLPILEKELIEQPSQKIVQATQEKLDKLGISSQAFPREINLFYLSEDSRKRIEQSGDEYFVVDSDVRWNKNEILDELHTYPERFSPNVLIRPLYQEFILPNLAYIGGGGEIAYWLERKEQFEHFGIPFPVLIRRNSAMLVPSYMQDQIQELGIADQQLFDEEDAIINNFLAGQTSVDIQLSEEMAQINQVFDKMADKAEQIDPPLSKWILAEGTKTHKIVEQIESRLKRAIKKKEENKVNQIRKIKNKLFPNNGLQERYDNFFQYYLTEGDSLIDGLISGFNPLENKFAIIYL